MRKERAVAGAGGSKGRRREAAIMTTTSEETLASIEAERIVRERYLGEETGLRPAVFETMRRLYSLPRLPANPYFFVATQLSAHSAHSANSVWAVRTFPSFTLLPIYM